MTTQTLAQFQSQASPTDWALATQYANQYGIPTNIFQALVAKESSWNPTAQSPNSTSYGYTQLTAGTALQMGVNATDPASNLEGGAKYLSQMFTKFGNWNDALLHYNQGPNATSATALANGQQYASSVMTLANTAPATSPTPAPADKPTTGTLDTVLSWIKAQLGNFFFLLIGGALIVIAVLSSETGQKVAKTAVEAAAV